MDHRLYVTTLSKFDSRKREGKPDKLGTATQCMVLGTVSATCVTSQPLRPLTLTTYADAAAQRPLRSSYYSVLYEAVETVVPHRLVGALQAGLFFFFFFFLGCFLPLHLQQLRSTRRTRLRPLGFFFFFFFFFWVTGEMSIPLWQEAFKDARRT
ncbi:hypothetical protein ABBQ38_002008 [Trebouxia sp. C0009 RCD-2024]